MDAALTTAALAAAQATINRALQLDPGTRLALGELEGRILAISVSAPPTTVYLSPDALGMQLQSYCEQAPDTHLHGSLPALVRLAAGQNNNLSGSGVRVEGDTGLLLELRRILQRLDIDWEECLSHLLGDLTAHQGAQLLRGGARWLRDRQRSGERLLGEFLTEELRLLPAKNQLQDFYQQVDELRLATDRAEARLQQLIQSLQDGPDTAEANPEQKG